MTYRYITASLFAVTIVTVGVSFSARAHDPEKHKENVQSPDCAAMEDMDHGNMDVNDPLMQALMKQCSKARGHGHEAHEGHGDQSGHGDHNGHADHEEHGKQPDRKHANGGR